VLRLSSQPESIHTWKKQSDVKQRKNFNKDFQTTKGLSKRKRDKLFRIWKEKKRTREKNINQGSWE